MGPFEIFPNKLSKNKGISLSKKLQFLPARGLLEAIWLRFQINEMEFGWKHVIVECSHYILKKKIKNSKNAKRFFFFCKNNIFSFCCWNRKCDKAWAVLFFIKKSFNKFPFSFSSLLLSFQLHDQQRRFFGYVSPLFSKKSNVLICQTKQFFCYCLWLKKRKRIFLAFIWK